MVRNRLASSSLSVSCTDERGIWSAATCTSPTAASAAFCQSAVPNLLAQWLVRSGHEQHHRLLKAMVAEERQQGERAEEGDRGDEERHLHDGHQHQEEHEREQQEELMGTEEQHH